MRSRNIKPDYFRDYKLCQLDIFARVLFSGLWCLADREGRLEDCPPRIRADVFPYDNVDVEKLLESLATSGFITRYTVEDDPRQYIQIKNFHKHQNPHKNEKPSEIPTVEGSRVINGQTQVITGANRADSLNLIPDSLNIDSLINDSCGGEYFDMKQLNAMAVKYLGWQPVMTAGRAEQLRVLTSVFKADVERGFVAASAADAKSINYVIKAAQSKDKSKGALSEEEKRNMNAFLGEEVYQ